MIRTLFLIIIFFLVTLSIKAQKILQYGIKLNPGYGWLSSDVSTDIKNFSKQGNFNFGFSITGNYFLNKRIAIHSEIQFSNSLFQTKSDSYSDKFLTQDSEGKTYERQVTGENMSEKTSSIFIKIPLCFLYEYPISRNIHFYASIGPSLVFPIKSHMVASGSFTYKGYYKEGNYTLENIPIYGFNSDVPVKIDNSLGTAFFSVSGNASLGCNFAMSRHWKFFVSADYERSITSIIKSTSGNYHISNELGSYHSILESHSSRLQNISLCIGLIKILMF